MYTFENYIVENVTVYDDGWKDIICTHNKHTLCSAKDIIKLRQQLIFYARHT